jgi:heavy metal-binding protein
MRLRPAGLAALVLLGGLAASAQRPASPRVTLRFHHLHYAVDDPGAQLRPASEALQGVRAIVPGVGVGVRVEREYLLFARTPEERSRAARQAGSADEAYEAARRWLTSRGFSVEPASLRETLVGRALPSERLDHVAFAADDLASAIAALRSKPASSNDAAATFRAPSGALVEIVRDTDRPDAFWCPMHPDVRSPGESKCPLCGMALVPIPPLRPGEYRLDVTLSPRRGGGASRVRLAVREPDSGDVVTRFVDVHERPFHLFVISRDLERFAHVHPAIAADGSLELEHDLPPGVHLLVADFLPAGGTSQLVHRVVTTPGYDGPLFAAPPALPALPDEHVTAGVRIRMSAQTSGPRRAADIRFDVADAATGQAVTDLEPYLGAAGHLLIVDNLLTTAIHGHPEGAATAGPTVAFSPVLPAAGRYKLWVQFQRKGEVITAPFVIDVPQEIR